MALVWLALAVSVAAVVAAMVQTTLRGFELFRAFGKFGGDVGEELGSIERRTRAIEGHLQAAGRSGDALSAAAARLSASRARLNVLLAALADARAALGRLTGVARGK
jgi:hypothetical protein